MEHKYEYSVFAYPHQGVVRPVQSQEVSTFQGPSFNLVEGPDEGGLFPHLPVLDGAEDFMVLPDAGRDLPAI